MVSIYILSVFLYSIVKHKQVMSINREVFFNTYGGIYKNVVYYEKNASYQKMIDLKATLMI